MVNAILISMMEKEMLTAFCQTMEPVPIPVVVIDSELQFVYANRSGRQILPAVFHKGDKFDPDAFFEHEDFGTLKELVSECRTRGESIRTLKQRGAERYFRASAYQLRNCGNHIMFHFEDISQVRILEDQLYEHMVDLYSRLDTREREIADLKAVLLRVNRV